MQIFDLSNRIAVITGGSQGIGLAITRGLAEAGASVVIANRDTIKGEKAAESLKNEGLNAVAISTDVRKEFSVTNIAAKVIEKFGHVDILVNSAGITLRKSALDITKEEWDNIMNTNVWGVFVCCRTFGKEMMKQKKGKIILLKPIEKLIKSTTPPYKKRSITFDVAPAITKISPITR